MSQMTTAPAEESFTVSFSKMCNTSKRLYQGSVRVMPGATIGSLVKELLAQNEMVTRISIADGKPYEPLVACAKKKLTCFSRLIMEVEEIKLKPAVATPTITIDDVNMLPPASSSTTH